MPAFFTLNGSSCTFRGTNRDFGEWLAALSGEIRATVSINDVLAVSDHTGVEFFLRSSNGGARRLGEKVSCERWGEISFSLPWTDSGKTAFLSWLWKKPIQPVRVFAENI